MILTKVEIENFGSVKEKIDVKLNKGITTLIGLNESGKTTILNAINKLNGEAINPDEKNKHPDFIDKDSKIKGTFIIEQQDISNIEGNNPLIKFDTDRKWSFKVSIENNDATKYYSVYCDNERFDMNNMIKNNLLQKINELRIEYDIKDEFNCDDIIEKFDETILPFASNGKLYEEIKAYKEFIKWFNYLPEYKILKYSNKNILKDSIDIKDIPNNLQANNFFKIAGIKIDDLIKNSSNISSEMIANIEKSCSVKISSKFNEIFRQNDKNFEFTIKIDEKNHKIHFFIVDSTSNNYHIPLSKRSDGFNWYFSIYLTLFEYFNTDTNQTYILLFDEPNLYLNPAAQKDLIDVFKEEFKNSQIVYSTHSPYMIDSADYKTFRIVKKENETKVFNNIQEYCKDNKFKKNEVDLLTPILSALQLSVSNSLIIDSNSIPIIVEGIQDHYILNAMIKKLGYSEKMKKFKIIPCVGVNNVPLIYSYLFGLGYEVVVLVDGDEAGKRVIKSLKNSLEDLNELNNKLFTYSVVKKETEDIKLEDLLCGNDSKNVNHNNTLTYKTFFDEVDTYDLNQQTIKNFEKLFEIIIKNV